MKNAFYIMIVLLALVPLGVLVYTQNMPAPRQLVPPVATIDYSKPIDAKMESGAEFQVKAVRVKDGFRYDLLLENDEWIEAHLARATKEEATPFVVELMKEATNPSVILHRKIDNFWIVDMILEHKDFASEARFSLGKLLGEKGLAF